MRMARKRQVAARILLLVFVIMMLMTSTHVHHAVDADDGVCSLCINHIHHSGHLSAQGTIVHDCLICQLYSLPYVLPVVAAFIAFVLLTQRIRRQMLCSVSARCIYEKSPRAPPVIM